MKFRKKPVVIEAFQMTPERRDSNADWPQWMHEAWQLDREAEGALRPTVAGTSDGTLSIVTREGVHLVSWGDWIIRGVKGELYPCKPDIFEATYTEVGSEKEGLPENCKLVAHNTGDGWFLGVQTAEGDDVCELAWPKKVPWSLTAADLERFGFEVV
jgi:hypothetical protein